MRKLIITGTGMLALAAVRLFGVAPLCTECRAEKPTAHAFFPFCIDWHDSKKRTYAQQAPMLKELGYDGVGHIGLDGVAERLKTLDAAGLKLYQITMWVDLTPDKPPYDAHFKEVLDLVKGRHVQFDLIINGMKPSDPAGDERGVKILRECLTWPASPDLNSCCTRIRATGSSGSRTPCAWPTWSTVPTSA